MARPKQQGFLVNLRGTEEYARFLTRLAKLETARGINVKSHNRLAEWAIELLAASHGLVIPQRMPPRGRPRKNAAGGISEKLPKSRKKS
jgi:hypothetical protein